MRYMLTRIYDAGVSEIREITKDDIEKEGLTLGYTSTKDLDIYVDEFETDKEFEAFWNKCKAEGAKVVLF